MSLVVYGCGCSFRQDEVAVEVKPCERHRKLDVVSTALARVRESQRQLGEAVRQAHAELSPMEIEQEERQVSGDERWR